MLLSSGNAYCFTNSGKNWYQRLAKLAEGQSLGHGRGEIPQLAGVQQTSTGEQLWALPH